MSQNPAELGRIIRGEHEEIWSLAEDGGKTVVRFEANQVAGDDHKVSYLSPSVFYASNAPKSIKDKLLKHQLYA
jgi:hypothetical protein